MKLYPGHQHQWVFITCGRIHEFGEDCNHESDLVACTVCGFTAPRNLAKLDGRVTVNPETGAVSIDVGPQKVTAIMLRERCTHQDAGGQCLDHQGHLGDHQHPRPEQEST